MVKSIELASLKFRGDEIKTAAITKALLKDWYVFCSVTGEPIPVTELKYWNVERNEVYKDAETGSMRHKDLIKT